MRTYDDITGEPEPPLTVEQQKKIVRLLKDGVPIKVIAQMLNVSEARVTSLCNDVPLKPEEQQERKNFLINYENNRRQEINLRSKKYISQLADVLEEASMHNVRMVKDGLKKIAEVVSFADIESVKEANSLVGLLQKTNNLCKDLFDAVQDGDKELLEGIMKQIKIEQNVQFVTETVETVKDESGLVKLDSSGKRVDQIVVTRESESRKMTFGK